MKTKRIRWIKHAYRCPKCGMLWDHDIHRQHKLGPALCAWDKTELIQLKPVWEV